MKEKFKFINQLNGTTNIQLIKWIKETIVRLVYLLQEFGCLSIWCVVEIIVLTPLHQPLWKIYYKVVLKETNHMLSCSSLTPYSTVTKISSYLYEHHTYFKYMTFMCKKHEPKDQNKFKSIPKFVNSRKTLEYQMQLTLWGNEGEKQ